MGKSRRSRAKGGQRSDPIAKPVKPPADPELAALREKSILPVIKDLQSPDPKSRTAAAGAVANIVQDTKCRKLLLREQIVPILLTETLTDTSLESRAAGWEILRVLTAEEEADFCVHLYRIDALTAIHHAAAKITEALADPSFSKKPKAEQNRTWAISEALSDILAALAGAQDVALEAASKDDEILRFLFTLVSTEFTTASALKSALSCMITFSEENQQFVDAILGDGRYRCYNHLVDFTIFGDFKAVYACGVLHNIFAVMGWSDQNPGRDGACDAVLVPALSQTLANTNLNATMANNDGSENSADTLQIAFEVLASIGTSFLESFSKGRRAKGKKQPRKEDKKDVDMDVAMDTDVMDADDDNDEDEDEEADDDEGSDDEQPADEEDEMSEGEMEADMDMVTGVDEDEPSGLHDLPTLKELVHRAIPVAVRLFQAIPGEGELSNVIRAHTLTALSNIAWAVSCLDFSESSNDTILRAWTPVAKLIWKDTIAPVLASNTSDVELATIVTSLAWAVARTLHETDFLSGEEHQKFISLYHASKNLPQNTDDPLQGLGVKCVGVLGQLARDPAPAALNREIGVFLVTLVAGLPETPVADAAEALNQLFDIYGDENSANDKEVFWKDNFLQHLEATVPKVKAMVKTVDKRTQTELRIRAEEASLNLSRFIQYKQKHRA
ncbi:hypothetical protein GGS20DRAFT_568974 [Poronia punctata]|nr:hypothetical protein GGS20DRAFT_568974 [Poronia punctata]